jgi:hypothetical protein
MFRRFLNCVVSDDLTKFCSLVESCYKRGTTLELSKALRVEVCSRSTVDDEVISKTLQVG